MDFSTLEELVKVPKKGNASKEKKQVYLSEMALLLSGEGYSTSAEKYLVLGFSFCSVSPLILFMNGKNSEEKYVIFEKITRGSLFRKNDNGISFKVMISLLCQIINNYPEEQIIVESLICYIPNLSRNKEGNISGAAAKVIEKYFVNELNDKSILPDLSLLNIEPAKIAEFCKLFSNLLSSIEPSNKKDIDTTNKIKKWISINDQESYKAHDLNNKENEDIQPNKKQHNDEKELSKKPFKSKELLEFAEYLKQTVLRIPTTASYIKSLEKTVNTLKENLINSNNKYDLLKKDFETLKEEHIKKISETEKLFNEKVKLDLELIHYRHQYNIKIAEIEMLKQEIEKQNSVISVFSADKQSAKNEQLNAIASKLKSEYIDYKDAIDMQMTVDLGENLRQQLNTIFKILVKNGINIEGR